MKAFEMDWARTARTGIAEAVFCEHKTPRQIAAILAAAKARKDGDVSDLV